MGPMLAPMNLAIRDQMVCSLFCTEAFINTSQIARFMGSTWGPPGSCRPQMVPCWPHEPCYQGCYMYVKIDICISSKGMSIHQSKSVKNEWVKGAFVHNTHIRTQRHRDINTHTAICHKTLFACFWRLNVTAGYLPLLHVLVVIGNEYCMHDSREDHD